MNKGELIYAFAVKSNVTKKKLMHFLNALVETIVEAVAQGDKVSLIGFGSFEPRQRQALIRSQSKNW